VEDVDLCACAYLDGFLVFGRFFGLRLLFHSQTFKRCNAVNIHEGIGL